MQQLYSKSTNLNVHRAFSRAEAFVAENQMWLKIPIENIKGYKPYLRNTYPSHSVYLLTGGTWILKEGTEITAMIAYQCKTSGTYTVTVEVDYEMIMS